MNKIKKIISMALPAMLTLSLLTTGAPVRSPVVADGGQSLKDALLSAKDFLSTAQNPEKFEKNVVNLISALQVSAGLKTVIQKDGKKQVQFNHPVFMLSTLKPNAFTETAQDVHESVLIYITRTNIPEIPPPKC